MFEFSERTPHTDRGRLRMRSKRLAVDRELVSSLGTLLQLKVRRQHSDVSDQGWAFGTTTRIGAAGRRFDHRPARHKQHEITRQ